MVLLTQVPKTAEPFHKKRSQAVTISWKTSSKHRCSSILPIKLDHAVAGLDNCRDKELISPLILYILYTVKQKFESENHLPVYRANISRVISCLPLSQIDYELHVDLHEARQKVEDKGRTDESCFERQLAIIENNLWLIRT